MSVHFGDQKARFGCLDRKTGYVSPPSACKSILRRRLPAGRKLRGDPQASPTGPRAQLPRLTLVSNLADVSHAAVRYTPRTAACPTSPASTADTLYNRRDEFPGISIGGLVILNALAATPGSTADMLYNSLDEPPGTSIGGLVILNHERFLSVSARRRTGRIARGVNKCPKDFRCEGDSPKQSCTGSRVMGPTELTSPVPAFASPEWVITLARNTNVRAPQLR